MAPKRGQSVERTEDYDEFLKKLAEFHEKRGTKLETEPKVGIRHINLHTLYERVVGEGGYDLCSDTKAKPLMWRKFAEEFVGKNPYSAAQAFQMKQIYYKNLVAYEITNHWQKEPPPKEILEEVTAKGGGVMSRTVENFSKPPTREDKLAAEGDVSDSSPGRKTPGAGEDKLDQAEEPGSAQGRTSRGLRQQPPQRVLFQPDLTAQGRTRGQNHAGPSPTPGPTMNGIMNPSLLTNGVNSTLASYEPTPSYPLTLRPVVTPSNNPEHYRNERKRKLEATAGPLARKYRNIMLPGTGFIGPNIYVRAQLALQSGIPEEEAYALHHLVKISYERGDRYKFDQFPGLADALARKVLQASGLFYDVEWEVNYDDETFGMDDETLNGLTGTSGIIAKLKSRMTKIADDGIQDAAFLSQLNRINEACLVIRNMCILDSNAMYAAGMPLIKDMIAVVLNLPNQACTTELRHSALEIAEQILRYIDLGAQDDLYQSLVANLDSTDRGTVVTTLKTIARIAMNLPPPKRLEDIPNETLCKVQDWLLVDDEELRGGCLDFLLQYTSFADNVDNLLQSVDFETLARQLTTLLSFGAQEVERPAKIEIKHMDLSSPPVPRLSRSIVDQLLTLEQPERSSEWLRMCFIQDAKSEMTQISLWQAYQGTFGPTHATHPHLIAGDFIKNVSAVFNGATAQVAGQNKYVIRGIKARKIPVETGLTVNAKPGDKDKELMRCCWKQTISTEAHKDPSTGLYIAPVVRDVECGEWFRSTNEMLKHVILNHLQIPRATKTPPPTDLDHMDVDSHASTNGFTNGVNGDTSLGAQFDFSNGDDKLLRCRWANCTRTSAEFINSAKGSRTALLARHIQTHLPSPDPNKNNIKPTTKRADEQDDRVERPLYTTLQDDRMDAAGLPLGAALVLRNIARFMPKTLGNSDEGLRAAMGVEPANEEDTEDVIDMFFDGDVKRSLFEALSRNKTLQQYVGGVLRNLARSLA